MNNFVYRVFQTLTITFPLELPSIMSTKAFGMRSKPSDTVSWPWKVNVKVFSTVWGPVILVGGTGNG